MIPNADLHSPPHAPVHLNSAGYPFTTPSSPVVGVFGQWGEQSESQRSSAMGSFVNKAKAIWRGKRHTYQWAGSADLRGDKNTSRPATQRQATLPLPPPPSTFGSFARRPTRRRDGGSLQISSPTFISGSGLGRYVSLGGEGVWPLDTEADISREFIHIRSARSNGYERRSSLPATIDGNSKCNRYSRSMSASTLAPPDTSYLTVGPPRAGSVPNLKESESAEFDPSVNVSSEYNAVCCASPMMMDGLELGVSDTMVAISQAGLLQSSESEDLLEDTRKLREALANMFPIVEIETKGSLANGASRDCTGILHDIIDGCLEGEGNSPLYHLQPQEGDELGSPRDQSVPEFPAEPTLATSVIQSLWAPQDSSQPHLRSGSLHQPEIQSTTGPHQVKIVSNEISVLELDVSIESTTTLSRPTLKPLHIESVASRSRLHVSPRVPTRSPSRPNLAQRARSSPATSTLPDTSLRAPPRPCTSDLTLSNASGQAPESSFYTARPRGTTRSLFVESQIAQVMRAAPVPGPFQMSRLGRSQSRLPKMRSKSKSLKKPTPADIGRPIQTDHANEWIVVTSSSSRTLHQRKASRSSFRRSLYAQSSIFSRRSGISEVSSMRTGIVKSPSIRSGLTNLSAKPGLRASQSRSALHTRSRARLYSHGINPKLSTAALQINELRASPSIRSLPDASKDNLTLSTEPPYRPPRSPARPHPERRLENMSEKENRPSPRIEGATPLEFTLQLAASFEAAIERRFACSNFTGSPPTPGLQRSRTTKARPSGMSRKQDLNEVHALVAGIGGNGALLRRTPTIAVPPRNTARVAMGVRSGNWI